MRWASFLLISASLHALIFTLPLAPSLQRDGHAIPVTLLIARDGSRQEPTPEGISITSKKFVRPPVASKQQPALEQKESKKDTEAIALIERTKKAAQLKKPEAVYEKKPQKKASAKRVVTESTRSNVSKPATPSTDHKREVSKLNRKDKVKKAPATPRTDSINSRQDETKDTSDKIIVEKYNSQDKKIAKLKVFPALNEKKPQKKAFTKRSAADPTMINVSEPASILTEQKSVVSKLNRKDKVQKAPAIPSPAPTKSSLADTGSETIVEKDNSHEAKAAVEISAFLEDSDEADISEPENLFRKTIGTEAIDERFSNAVPQETTIALRSRQEGDGSRVFKPAGLTRRISPKYPKRARRKGWEGTTLLRVLVDRRGKSKTIQVSQSSGFAALDGAAVKAVEQWRFYPAQNGNGPVESWVRVPIIFRLVRDQN